VSASALVLAVGVVLVAWLTAAATAVRSVSRVWLRRWAEHPLLRRVIVSHGDIIDREPQAALKALAATLDQ